MTVVSVREGRMQASSHRRRSQMALCSLDLFPSSAPILEVRGVHVRSLSLAPERRGAAHEECVGRLAKKAAANVRQSAGSCWASSTSTCDLLPRATACSLVVVSAVAGLGGLTSPATRVASGTYTR